MRIVLFVLAVLCFGVVKSQDQMFEICPLKVGQEIPEALLKDGNDVEYLLEDLIAEKPSVLIFYRGAWCGYCTKHLAELNDIRDEVDSLGYQFLGITIDEPSKLEETSSRSESEIPVYSDSDLDVIESFGLDWKVDDELFGKYKNKYNLDLEEWSGQDHHSLPVPAIFVVKEGIIQFQYVNPNYRVRLNPETLLAILATL